MWIFVSLGQLFVASSLCLCLWMQEHLKMMSSVKSVRLERFQTTLMLSPANHTHSKMWMERKTYYLQIPHKCIQLICLFFFSLPVRCEGGSVLRQGSSTADTLCDVTPPPLTKTTEVSLQISPKHPHPRLTKPSSFWSQTVQPMNATTTPSLLPSSSMTAIKTTNSSDTDTPTLMYCTGKYGHFIKI